MNTLHVYGPRWWHDSATLVGNKQSLEHLRQLIDMALETQSSDGEMWTLDGEGFHMRVICAEDDNPYWQQIAMPYSDEDARTKGREWPSDY